MEIGSDIAGVVIRTVSVYLFIIILLILLGKRELSQINIADLVFIMLISNAVQNAMVGVNTSLEGGLIAAGVLFLTSFLFRFLNYKYSFFRKLIEGEPKLLVYEGRIQDANLHKERITYEELMAAVREHGVDKVEHVALAMLETDGSISIISGERKKTTHKRRHRARGFLKMK